MSLFRSIRFLSRMSPHFVEMLRGHLWKLTARLSYLLYSGRRFCPADLPVPHPSGGSFVPLRAINERHLFIGHHHQSPQSAPVVPNEPDLALLWRKRKTIITIINIAILTRLVPVYLWLPAILTTFLSCRCTPDLIQQPSVSPLSQKNH